ncbi:MAG: hypothetical protein ABID54_01560 [Pseudomonadota bacterium]
MEKENNLVENSSGKEGQSEISGESKINEPDWDWNDYVEEILYYGLQSWRGG